jgi:hypothetical protein
VTSSLRVVDEHVRSVIIFVVVGVLVVARESRSILVRVLAIGVSSTSPVRNLKNNMNLYILRINHLAKSVSFAKRLVRHILKFLWDLAGTPAVRIILNLRRYKIRHAITISKC